MDIIKNNFQGKTLLWQVFWIQNVLIGGIFQLGVEKVVPHLSTIQTYLLVAFAAFYSIWVIVGMWQCAFNAKWKGWGYIVWRFYIAILGVVIITILRNV
jgi:hypothetical protein